LDPISEPSRLKFQKGKAMFKT